MEQAEIQNPTLVEKVEKDNPLKDMLVDYVGNKLNPEDDTVTLEMVIDVLAGEFPEFLLAVAEENWIRGYQQGLQDAEAGQKFHEQTKENS